NSTFSVNGDAQVGGAGGGAVTLTSGGRMSVGGQLTLAAAAGSSGVLNIGAAEGQPAAAAGTLDAAALAFGAGAGRVYFNHTDANYVFAIVMSGPGGVEHAAGTTSLAGDSSAFSGRAQVAGGVHVVNGVLGDSASVVDVQTGAVLGGLGVVGGDVVVADGGALAPGDLGVPPGELTIGGDLTLNPLAVLNYNFGQANVVGGPYNDLITVQGDLTLDGAINVTETPGGDFGPGIYRIISYGGLLSDLGLDETSPNHTVQTSVLQQVNLVNTAGVSLNFWDGPHADIDPGDRVIQGGDGDWRLGDNSYW